MDLGPLLIELVGREAAADGDEDFAYAVASFYQRHGQLTRPMEVAAWRLLDRAGVKLGGAAPVDDDGETKVLGVPEPQSPGAKMPELRRKADVRFSVEGNLILAKTPFSLKDLCKSVPGRKWDATNKRWTWPKGPVAALALRDAFAAYEPSWDDAFGELLGELSSAMDLKKADDLPDIDTISTVAWIHQRRAYAFVSAFDGAALFADMGCLTGDTIINVNRGGNGKRVRLDHLVEKFNGGKVDTGNGPRGWDTSIPTMVRGLRADGTTGLVPLVAAMQTGVKPVVTLILESGRTLRCTPDHEILTPDRWKVHAEDLAPGDLVLVDEVGGRGWARPSRERERYGEFPTRVTPPNIIGVSQDGGGYIWLYEPDHPMATPQGQVLEHRKVMADHLGRPLTSKEHVHHADGDVTNNALENLRLLSGREHARKHGWERNLAGSLPILDAVRSVIAGGEEPVYDLTVGDDAHTYTANGVIVGNTGKSLVAVARALDVGGDILIACPDKVLGVWPREFRKHGASAIHYENGLRPKRGGGHKKLKVRERVDAFEALRLCDCGRPHVYITNYETLPLDPLKSWMANRDWDMFIMDESHRIKSPTGLQAKTAAKVASRAAKRLLLTGTPMPHTPLDIWAQYRAMDSGVFGTSFVTFRNRYAVMGGYENKEVMGMNPATIDELTEKTFQFAFRVRAEDVLDLPDILPDDYLTCTMEGAQAKAYNDMAKKMVAEFPGLVISDLVKKMLEGETVAANAAVKALRLRQITGGSLKDDATGETLVLGDAKEKLLIDWMQDFPTDEPLVVFAEFTHDIATIIRVGEKLGRRVGEVSGRRNDLTADSEYPPDKDLLAVQIASGGAGVDLTRACYGAYYSIGYSNGNYRQSRARLHRPGQTRPVRFTHLVCEDTVDMDVFRHLEGRQEEVSLVMDHDKLPRDDAPSDA